MGVVEAVQLEASEAPVTEILLSLSRSFGIALRVNAQPGDKVTGHFEGPLPRVIAGVLRHFDYAMRVGPDAIEINFVGSRGGSPIVVMRQEQNAASLHGRTSIGRTKR